MLTICSSSLFLQELLTGFLIPLPFLLVTSTFQETHLLRPQVLPSETIRATSPSGLSASGVFETCALTAATFSSIGSISLVVEIIDARKRQNQTLVRDHVRRGSATTSSNVESVKNVLARGLGVGLPLYSAFKLGGSRVAMVLLTISALPSATDDYRDTSTTEGWKRFMLTRKATVASIALGILCDATFIMGTTDFKAMTFGYLALGMSVLVFQPPFPSISRMSPVTKSPSFSGPLTSAVKSIRGNTHSLTETPATQLSKSPLIATIDDTKHTLMTGLILGVMCTIATFMGPGFSVDTSVIHWPFLLLAVAFLAGMLLLVQPCILQSYRKIGLALGLSFTVLYHYFSFTRSWQYGTVQASIGLASYLAVAYDTNTVFKRPRLHSHGHEKLAARDGGHGHTKQSRFTKFLLEHIQQWSLIHSILAEKDSRRIFYFMWYEKCSFPRRTVTRLRLTSHL